MLVIRLLNLSKKFLVLFTFSLILYFDAIAVEPVDIWKNEKKEKINEADEKKGNDNSKIDFKKQSKDFGKIKINDNVDDKKDQHETQAHQSLAAQQSVESSSRRHSTVFN